MNFVGMDKLSIMDYEDKVSCVLFCKPCNFRCPFCHNGLTVLESNEEIDFEEVLSYLSKRKGVIDAVVLSGGEITLMPDLKEKIIQIKELGYLVKVDTNGSNPEVIKDLIDNKLIDYVAMDVKNSKDKYCLTTSTNINHFEKVVETFKILKSSPIHYEIRTTLVEEFHDESDIEAVGIAFKGAEKMYLQKFVDREGVIKKGLHPIDESRVLKFKNILEKYIENVIIRGY